MESFFLLTLFKHGYKAKTSTLYHLLKGKRTSSVLIYGFLYGNLPFFQLCSDLSESQFHSLLGQLYKQGLLEANEIGEAQVTTKGQKVIQQKEGSYLWLDNYRFGKTDETMWRLLQFLTQVISHLSYSDKHYIPLEQSPLYQKHIKRYIQSKSKDQLIRQVKQEWQELFEALSPTEANFLASQFSGYQQIGKATFQLLDDSVSVFQQLLLKKNTLHHLFCLILEKDEGSLLKELILPFIKQNENQSMNETYYFLNHHYSIEEIAQKRKVKRSTIQDHLLELALIQPFPFEDFLSQQTISFLDQYSPPYQDWVYRSLKQVMPELDYFEFRLYQIQKIRTKGETVN